MKKLINKIFHLNNVNRYSSFDELCVNARGELGSYCKIEKNYKN